jgi:hypothetical protein
MLIKDPIIVFQVLVIMFLIASSAQLMSFHNKKLLLHSNPNSKFMPHSHGLSLEILTPIFFYLNQVLYISLTKDKVFFQAQNFLY